MIGDVVQLSTVVVNKDLDVQQRLRALREWDAAWQREDALVHERILQLADTPQSTQLGVQLRHERKMLRILSLRSPLEIDQKIVRSDGYAVIQQSLATQFAELSQDDRLVWLNNLLFLMTPALREISDKIVRARARRTFGQQRNCLIGGLSGMGKTTYLEWYMAQYKARVEATRNYVPVVMVEAPVSDRGPRPLLRKIVAACGRTYTQRDSEDELLDKIELYFEQCGVELLIVDEINHVRQELLRRRFLELSNRIRPIPIICASCEPLRWVEDDIEITGRWNDHVSLNQYTGKPLQQLLAAIDLLLPFPQPSSLAWYTTRSNKNKGETTQGIANCIEQWTGGILREIMLLIIDASTRAIKHNMPRLTPEVLAESWKSIRTNAVQGYPQLPQYEQGM